MFLNTSDRSSGVVFSLQLPAFYKYSIGQKAPEFVTTGGFLRIHILLGAGSIAGAMGDGNICCGVCKQLNKITIP